MSVFGFSDLAFMGAVGGVAAYDTDAQAYITAVETADGQALETAVKDAINDFVVGCKADGIWPAIKASCIMAGARTLAGALVPLVGTAPTNYNFVAGDYDRKTGLVGDGSTKYLDTNRASNADPQNSLHQTVFLSSAGTTTKNRTHIGNSVYPSGTVGLTDVIALSDNRLVLRNRNPAGVAGVNLFAAPAGSTTGFLGTSRAASNTMNLRYAGSTSNVSATIYTINADNYVVFARNGINNSAPSIYSDARIAFYSIGEALDLALLDARVTALINAFAAAIP